MRHTEVMEGAPWICARFQLLAYEFVYKRKLHSLVQAQRAVRNQIKQAEYEVAFEAGPWC